MHFHILKKIILMQTIIITLTIKLKHTITYNECLYYFEYLKIDAFYPEGFCDKNLAIWKVFAFSDLDKGGGESDHLISKTLISSLF